MKGFLDTCRIVMCKNNIRLTENYRALPGIVPPLFGHRKSYPPGMVRVQRFCHLNDSLMNRRQVVPTTHQGVPMSRFRKIPHTLWHCRYHIIAWRFDINSATLSRAPSRLKRVAFFNASWSRYFFPGSRHVVRRERAGLRGYTSNLWSKL